MRSSLAVARHDPGHRLLAQASIFVRNSARLALHLIEFVLWNDLCVAICKAIVLIFGLFLFGSLSRILSIHFCRRYLRSLLCDRHRGTNYH